MTSADIIIAKFGSSAALARALSMPATTIQHWKKVGWVPPKHQFALLTKAREMGISIDAADLIPSGNGAT